MWITREKLILFYLTVGDSNEQLTKSEGSKWDTVIVTGVAKPENTGKTAVALAEYVNIKIKYLQQSASEKEELKFYAYIDPSMDTQLRQNVVDALKLIITDAEVTILEQLD